MKKLLLTVAVVLLASGAFAQVRFGVKAGALWTNVSNLEDSKFKLGANGGLILGYDVNDRWGIQTEALYSMQGAQSAGSENLDMKLQYVNVPVMGKIYLDSEKYLSIEVGLQVGYLMKADYKYDGSTYSVEENMKRWDYSLAFGASGTIGHFGLQMRGNVGLSDIMDEESDDHFKNEVVQVALFYMF